MKKTQQQIDAEAVKEGLGTGADQVGGQDRLDRPRRDTDDGPRPDDMKAKFQKRGIRMHDEGPDTWGIKKLPRYERD